MSGGAMIVSIISVFACLILVTRSQALGRLGVAGVVRLALIWGAIIVGLVVVIELLGLRVSA